MSDSSKIEEARKWVDSIQNRWRLQILSRKFRIDRKTGEQVEMPTRIRRFVEGVPWSLVQESVSYLLSLAPYRGIVYNGVEIDGEYRPTLTTWKRDDNDEVNSPTSTRRNDGTYTLIQDLIDSTRSESYSATSQVSCSEEVVTEWHWDEENIQDLPVGGEQGVSYAITSVGRSEDGTFSYALVKRVAKTQHMPRTKQTEDAVSSVSVETWNNVYGNVDEGFRDELGNPLSIPESHVGDGSKCEVSVSENDDCTFKITAQWTSSKPVEAAKESCSKDQFKHEHSTTSFGQAGPLPEAPESSGGVVTEHDSQLNPDGTHTNVVATKTELPVSQSVVEVHVGRRGTRKTVVDVNQTEPADTSSVGVGGTVKTEKTPGKLFNNTITTWIQSQLAKVADVCKIDLFRHQHSKTQAGLSSIPDDDVAGSGTGGVVKTRTTQMDDEGSVTQTLETETEKPVEKSRESWIVGLFGLRHRVESQHQSAPVPAPSSIKKNIGLTVVNEKTPGGLYNTTVEEIDRTAEPVGSGNGCAKTVFEHEDTVVTRNPDGSMPAHVDEAGGGVHRSRTSSLNDDGSSTVTEKTTAEKKVVSAEVEYRRTAKAIFTRSTDRNTMEFAAPPSNAGETESHTTNPGGSRNVTKTKITVTGGIDRSHCRRTVFEHEHDSAVVTTGTTADTSDAPAPGGGKTFTKESVVDDSTGLVTTTTRTTEEQEVPDAEVVFERKLRGLVKTTTTKSGTVPAKDPGAANVGSVERQVKTPGGRIDLTVRTLTPSAEPDSARCQTTVFEHVHDTVTMSKGSVDKEGAPNAGGGHYYEKTSDLDGDGFAKTVVRDHTELNTQSGCAAYADNHYSSTSTTMKGQGSAKTSASSSIGRIESTRSVRQPGGTWEVTTETQVAKPAQIWSAESTGNIVKIATVGFFNLPVGSFSSTVGGLINKGVSWATSLSNGVASDGVRFSCSSTLNKFGLLDGSATVIVQWPATSLMNVVSCSVRFTEKHTNVKPMYRTSTDASGNVVLRVINQISTIERQCEFCAGFGRSAVEARFGGTVYPGTRATFNPHSGQWSGLIIKGEKTEIQYDTSNVRTIQL